MTSSNFVSDMLSSSCDYGSSMHAEFRNLPLEAAHLNRDAVTDIRSRADTRTVAVLGWCLCRPSGMWRCSSGLVYQQAEIPRSLADRNIEYLSIVCLCNIWLKHATLILSVVLCGCTTFFHLLKEEQRMGGMLKKIFGPEKEPIRGGRRNARTHQPHWTAS